MGTALLIEKAEDLRGRRGCGEKVLKANCVLVWLAYGIEGVIEPFEEYAWS